jgi:hypothetical protein
LNAPFLFFFLRQLHRPCMTASAHFPMVTEAVIYSSYLRDVVLVRERAIAHENAAACFAAARLQVRDAAADNVVPLRAIDAIEAAVMCDDFDEGLAQARQIYETLMRSESVTRLRDRFFAERDTG